MSECTRGSLVFWPGSLLFVVQRDAGFLKICAFDVKKETKRTACYFFGIGLASRRYFVLGLIREMMFWDIDLVSYDIKGGGVPQQGPWSLLR